MVRYGAILNGWFEFEDGLAPNTPYHYLGTIAAQENQSLARR